MTFTPLINYTGYEHVLNAAPCFVHPGNGTLYGCAIEKRGDVRQDLSIYRVKRGATAHELVKRYAGGVDAVSQFAMGGCALLQDGTLEVWASFAPLKVSGVTKTGFQGMWDRIAGVDEPWSGGDSTDMLSRIAQLESRLAQAGLPSRSTVVAAPDDPIWQGNSMRVVQVLEYYGWIERG